MGRGAAAPATVVIGTVEILDIVIALVEVVIQVVTAIRAYQQAAEHITFAVLRLSTANLATLFLNLFPDHTINNQLMHVFENRPVFPVVGNPLLVFVGFGVGLEIVEGRYHRNSCLPGCQRSTTAAARQILRSTNRTSKS